MHKQCKTDSPDSGGVGLISVVGIRSDQTALQNFKGLTGAATHAQALENV